jgi:hypothetical protein
MPDQEELTGIIYSNLFDEWARIRRFKEIEWIASLRQHKGIYDPETLANMTGSRVYPKMTRSKTVMVLSKLHEMLFPGNDRNWEIDTTPVPQIPEEKIASMVQQYVKETGKQVTQDVLMELVDTFAKETSSRMQAEIDDQLEETKYEQRVAKPVLKSGVIFGTGVAKGPMTEKTNRVSYVPTSDSYKQEIKSVKRPYSEHTPIWNWYPDMTVTEYEDGQGSFELHIMKKQDLYDLARRKDFDGKFIKEYLIEHPNGDMDPMPWEQDLRGIVNDFGLAYSKESSFKSSGETKPISYGARYRLLEFWGLVNVGALRKMNITIRKEMEDEEDIEANLWILGNRIIKQKLLDTADGHRPYKIFYFEKDETSVFGEGLPVVIRHSAISVASAARMLLNNAAITSGPMFEINYSLLQTVAGADDIHPMKIWWREGSGVDAQYPAVRAINADSHINEYLAIIEQFRKFSDEESTYPTWLMAEPSTSHNETVGGTSMRMSTFTMSLKDLVKNHDDFTSSMIEGYYAWNMKNSAKDEIKGDYKVKARGSSSLVMKEVRMQSMNQFHMTLQPEDYAYIPRGDFLREKVKINDLDIKVRTDEEAQKWLESQKDPDIAKLQKEDMEAEIMKKKAQAASLTTKAAVNVKDAGGEGDKQDDKRRSRKEK